MSRKANFKSQSLANSLTALERRLGPIEYRATSSLLAYDRNPRLHPEQQILKLAASMREFGFAVPILIDETGTIVAGHARVEAARRLGVPEVPVIVANHWTDAQVRAFRLADNRLTELATWDQNALALEISAIIELDETPIEILGWDTAEIDLVLEADVAPATQDDDPADAFVEPETTAVSQSGDLWALGDHRLLCGSSLDAACWERLLGDETAAMAFTDPPYNVPVAGHVSGLGKASHQEFRMASGEMSKTQFITFLTDSLRQMGAQLKEGAVLNVCMDWRHIGELLAAFEANALEILNLCVWNKTNGGMGSLYRSKHELVFIAKKGDAAHTNNVELGRHGRYRTNVWDYAGANGFGKDRMTDLSDHPTVKPVALVADAIRDVTHLGEIVIDAFTGSGTTILAAEQTRRRAFGIEIEPRYVDFAVRRWEALTGERARLCETGESHAEVAARRATQSLNVEGDSLDSRSPVGAAA